MSYDFSDDPPDSIDLSATYAMPSTKTAVRLALITYTPTDPTTIKAGDTVNGLVVAEGDRILIARINAVGHETAAVKNGIYLVGEDDSARASDADAAEDFTANHLVPVTAGTFTNQRFRYRSGADPEVGTDSLVYWPDPGKLVP
jgi:hypothetical protein